MVAPATFRWSRIQSAAQTGPLGSSGAASDGPAVPGAAAVAAMAKFMPLMSFATLVTVAVVPLAATLYVVTSTTWTAVERRLLHRNTPGTPGTTGSPAAAV